MHTSLPTQIKSGGVYVGVRVRALAREELRWHLL